MDNFHVLIIGGGNCGLAIATGFKKAGISYTIFERDSKHDFRNKTRDWGMLLHWGGEYLENILPEHLKFRIKEPRVDPFYEMTDAIPYINGATGDVLASVPTESITRVSRKKLRRFLTEEEDLRIEYSKILRAISVHDNCVSVKFEDGTKATGNLVVGCDGSHSKVREFLVGKEDAQLKNVGLTMVNYAGAGYTPEQARILRSYHPIVKLCYHPNVPGTALLAALDIPDPRNTTNWKFQVYSSWWGEPYAKDLHDPVQRLEFIKEKMSKFCEPYRTAFLSIDDDQILPIYAGQQWAPDMDWDNHGGRVTLAGDAAHSMLPHRGQGLNNAMKDASDIVDAIKSAVSGEQSLAGAISTYEAEMKVRGSKEVALSLEQAEKTRDWDTVMEGPIFRVGHRRT